MGLSPKQMADVSAARDACRTGEGRRLRQALGLKVTEVAEKAGISASLLSRWERGERLPNTENALGYADALAAMRKAKDRKART